MQLKNNEMMKKYFIKGLMIITMLSCSEANKKQIQPKMR